MIYTCQCKCCSCNKPRFLDWKETWELVKGSMTWEEFIRHNEAAQREDLHRKVKALKDRNDY